MKSILGVVFFIFPFSGITACENIKFNEVQKNEEVFYDVSNIVVTAKDRTFFNDLPLDECKSKKFIINGDKAISYASYNGFQYVGYLDRKGEVHTGWVDSTRITKKEKSPENLNVKKSDFAIHFNGYDIKVGGDYSEVIGAFNGFTEMYSGNGFADVFKNIDGVDYKFYHHDFGFIYIESSNLDYNKLKRDFDDYRITKVIIKKDVGFSSRGIYVGSKMLDVIKVYGVPASKKDDAFTYIRDNYMMKFFGSEVVNEIEISINPM
ncbi:hypothetical protein [Aeromonas dhakensis]|uniref:hypothetical protein n=1 Tax=Aeromonas dhakensis TaxID=196024 RepID=UPI00191EFA7B|nr:hypothetical protein [Aeromonas dhakensis]MBL0524846.1 hypothetical protein [Aeromonas dhakensis]BEE08967.1 hypothetical protein VAWG003_17760 [Aeromonas dhakensis]BEE25851.1 hypothetical protein VAWG005_17790 [Aeromonas dhakensis]